MYAATVQSASTDAERLLLALCRRNRSAAVLQEAVNVLGVGATRDALLALAEDHRVKGLVLRTLEQDGVFDGLDPLIAQPLRAELTRLERVAAFWSMERDRVQALFADAGLDGVVLKGAALRETIYERPVERHVRDLDVLFDRVDVKRALDVLDEAGYRLELPKDEAAWFIEHHFHIEVIHPTGFVVEVHWALTRPGRPWQVDPVRFLDRARSIEPEGVDLLVPSDEDMMIHLASQALEDQFRQLRRLVDMDRIVSGNPDLDWDYVWRAAQDGQMEIVMACALQLCHSLLDTPIPPDFRTHLGASRLATAHLALQRPDSLVLDPRPGSRARKMSLRFWMAPRWQDRSLILTEPLFDASRLHKAMREGDGPGGSPRRIVSALGTSAYYSLAVLAYHGWLYSRGALDALLPPGRRSVGFWRLTPSRG